jgi:hypothetical protein
VSRAKWKGPPPDPEHARIHKTIIDVLVREGSPTDNGDQSWGWIARDWEALRQHVAACGLDYAQCAWDDSRWSEFTGSFSEDRDCQGIDTQVTCRCGQVRRTWRFHGSYAELIRAFTGSTS